MSFTGDGGSNQGTFLESLNLAAVWHLPCVFVVENNGYAESTSDRFHASGVDIAKRADGFGMPGVVVDGHDFFAVYEAAGAAIEGPGRRRPSLLECKVNRYYGHFEGDQQTYRAPGEVDELRRTRDCLEGFAGRVTSAGWSAPTTCAGRRRGRGADRRRRREGQGRPEPEPADLLTDVYVKY